jgi:hypothetical protein
MESKLLEIFYDMSAIYGKSISVGFNTFKGKGIMVISRKRIFICFWVENISFSLILSLSKLGEKHFSPFSLLFSHAHLLPSPPNHSNLLSSMASEIKWLSHGLLYK